MNVIYGPRGKAGEYSKWALNIYNGCSHGCTYCYVPVIVKRKYKDFISNVTVRRNILELLEGDLKKHHEALHTEENAVLLCFTCDPYQPMEAETALTRRCLNLFTQYEVPVQILTKGCKIAQRDFDLLVKNRFNKYAVTMTHTNNYFLKKLEPNASTFEERVYSLELAKEKGITTWVSLEPVVSFEETYKVIDETHLVVDEYKVGKLNYDPYEKQLDWVEFRETVIEKLEKYNSNYYIKKDLEESK
jgi:DNA repair photolyase